MENELAMFSILDDRKTTPEDVERAVSRGLIAPVAAAEWRVMYRRRRRVWPLRQLRKRVRYARAYSATRRDVWQLIFKALRSLKV